MELSRAGAVAGTGVMGLLGFRAARPSEESATPLLLNLDQLEQVNAIGDALIVREPNGRVTAFARKCPHLGCAVGVNHDRNGFECPCHGSRFDLSGRRIGGPADRDLPSLQVVAEAQGRVKIE